MTNTEYETACVKAAMGQRKLAAVDAKITETEKALVFLLHERREIVNQYDLNKGGKLPSQTYIVGEHSPAPAVKINTCEHQPSASDILFGGDVFECKKCGEKMKWLV